MFDEWDLKSITFVVGPTATRFVKLSERFYYTPRVSTGFAYSKFSILWESYGVAAEIQPLNFEFRMTGRWAINLSIANVTFKWMRNKVYFAGGTNTTTTDIDANILKNAGVGVRFRF